MLMIVTELEKRHEDHCTPEARSGRVAYAMRYVTVSALGFLSAGCTDWMDLRLPLANVDGGADAGIDADAGTDKGGCHGVCVGVPVPWKGPFLFRSGPAGQALDCPNMMISNRWNADLVVPLDCEPCTCGPSSGMCELPSKLTASTTPCNGGVQPIPFDAPPAWDGGCDNTNSIDAGANVKSLSIDPLIVTQESCAVDTTPGPPKPLPTSWKIDAIACDPPGWPWCSAPNIVCVNKDAFLGFRLCIADDGDRPCPNSDSDSNFTERYVFYAGVDDQRQCTACTCGPPNGSMCTAKVSVYQNSDNTCSGPTVYPSIGISSVMPTCVDINPPGQPLGSKSATSPAYIPGECAPVPGVVDPDGGTAIPQWPITICCQP